MASTRALLSSNPIIAVPTDRPTEEQEIPPLPPLVEQTAKAFAPEELIASVLPQVSSCLEEAETAWTEDEFGDASACLEEAFSLLQSLSLAVLPEPTSQSPQVESSTVSGNGDKAVDESTEVDWSQFLTVAA